MHAVRRFRRLRTRDILAVDAGTDILAIVPLLERADKVIAFDSLKAGGRPGSVYILSAGDVATLGVRGSPYELGLVSLLSAIKKPAAEVVIFAAEPELTGWGKGLSSTLKGVVPAMVRSARALTRYWSHELVEDSDARSDLPVLRRFHPSPNLC